MMRRRNSKNITYAQRQQLREMLSSGDSKITIAKALGISRSSVYNELERGNLNGEYDPEYAERIMQTNRAKKTGRQPILADNPELVSRIAAMILDEHLSPEKIIECFKQEKFENGEFPLSTLTIYRAIDKGLIPGVTRDSLKADTTSIYDDVLRFPSWFRNKLKIQDGDIFRFEANNTGQIILTKIGNKRGTTE